jgi:hypothetical protein
VAVEQRRHHVGADEGLPTCHLLQSQQQGIDVAALGDEAKGAGLERPLEQHLGIVHRIDQNARPRVNLTDTPDGFDAAKAFHAEIHDHGVRTAAAIRGVRLLATGRLLQYAQGGIRADQAAQTGAQGRVVVHHHHRDWLQLAIERAARHAEIPPCFCDGR